MHDVVASFLASWARLEIALGVLKPQANRGAVNDTVCIFLMEMCTDFDWLFMLPFYGTIRYCKFRFFRFMGHHNFISIYTTIGDACVCTI